MRVLPKKKPIVHTQFTSPTMNGDIVDMNGAFLNQPINEDIVHNNGSFLYKPINPILTQYDNQIYNEMNTVIHDNDEDQFTATEKYSITGASIFFIFLFLLCTRLILKRRERLQKAYGTYNQVANVKAIPWRSNADTVLAIEAPPPDHKMMSDTTNPIHLLDLHSAVERIPMESLHLNEQLFQNAKPIRLSEWI